MAQDRRTESFRGISQLLSTEGLDRLQAAHVCIIGIGGVGSWTAEALARSGVGSLTLVDMDDICVTNINRQIHATVQTIGQLKVEAMRDRIQLINPVCQVHCLPEFFTQSNAQTILSTRFDCVVDAIDSLNNKCLLLSECVKNQIPVVTTGGAGGKSSPLGMRCADLSRVTHDRLLAKVRKYARSHFQFPKDPQVEWGIPCVYTVEPQKTPNLCSSDQKTGSLRLNCETGYGTASFVTGPLGMAAAAEVVRLIQELPTSGPNM